MKKLIAIFLVAVMVLTFAACGSEQNEGTETKEDTTLENSTGESGEESETGAREKTDVNVYVITGPTGIGAVQMWDKAENGEGLENYHFTAVTSPNEVVSHISKGEADIAAIATNLAAKLYQVTSQGIQILAVNTLGVLNVLTYQGEQVSSLSDLKGRTVVTTGQGANPEFIIRHLMTQSGVDPDQDLTIEYKAEGTELVTVWANNPEAVIIAPQPVATSITKKYEGSAIVLDLTNVWDDLNSGSALMMGCIVVRTAFLNEHPEAVENFLKDYQASVKSTNDDPAGTGELCAKYGIVGQAPIATAAIPNCHIVYVTGDEMKNDLNGYLNVLFEADPSSIGGSMPDDGFYYAS